jgi:pantoate--beta-alanine ligase
MTTLVRNRAELGAARSALSGQVGLVPTMGALHEGHAALIRAAQQVSAATVVSIFVNPMQFDQAADLDRYPRVLEADLALCRQLGVDLVWAPEVSDVYPAGPVRVRVVGDGLASELEGASRPGHFDGALTVVCKLLGIVHPSRAFFGEKDYQQLVLVRQMVADLELGVQIDGVPTVREADGLALSSRNVFLSVTERADAAQLWAALAAAARSGPASAAAVLAAADAVLSAVPGIKIDYLQVRGPDLGPAPAAGPARLLVAGWLGSIRLIDNCPVMLSE